MASSMIRRGTPKRPSTPEVVIAASDASARLRRAAEAYCDGTADDVQIQAALDAGLSVRLLGSFTLAASLVLKFPGQAILGTGIDATTLALAAGVNDFAIKTGLPSGADRLWGARVSGLTIDGNMGNQSAGGGVQIDRGYFCDLSDLRILNTKAYGLRFVGTSGVYCAYNKARNVSVSVGLGHGIVCDSYSEFQELHGCNASFFQGGTVTANYFDEPAVDAGIGLYLKGGNNRVFGGHYDRCRVPIYLEFSTGNQLFTATDNALDCAVAIKGASSNRLIVGIGRMDPLLADGTTANANYGLRRAINLVNTSAGNAISPTFYADNNPPASPPATSLAGGWRYHVGESSGAGLAANGGRNVVQGAQPSGIGLRLDGGSGPVKTKTANYTVTLEDLAGYRDAGGGVILGDSSGGSITLTLPTAMPPGTYRFTARNIAASNNVVIAAGAGDSINGGSVTLTTGLYATLTVVQLTNAAAATWYRIG